MRHENLQNKLYTLLLKFYIYTQEHTIINVINKLVSFRKYDVFNVDDK